MLNLCGFYKTRIRLGTTISLFHASLLVQPPVFLRTPSVLRCKAAVWILDVAGDDNFLDLRRALVELENLCISHEFLYRVLNVETCATKDLYSICHDLVAMVSCEYLGHGREKSIAAALVYLVSTL